MFSSRLGTDARIRIEARRRAAHVQQRVNAVRRLQTRQQRGGQASFGNQQDLSSKLINSRRNRLGLQGQTKPSEKRLANFTVVTAVDDATGASPVQAIVRNTGNLRNFSLSIVNDKAQGNRPIVGTKRSVSTPDNSPLKRRRQVEEDDVAYTGTVRRGGGGVGMLVSALQRAQSQDSPPAASPVSSFYGRSTSMRSDGLQSSSRVSVLQRLSLPGRATASTTTAKTADGYRVLVSQLNDSVTSDDLKELFGSVGTLRDAYLIEPGFGEAIFIRKADAERAVKEFNNRELDGVPMHCELLPSVATPVANRGQNFSQSTLTARFSGTDNTAQLPVKSASGKKMDPDRDVVTGVLFGKQARNAKKDVTFTVKV